VLPTFLFCAIVIKLDSRGPIFFRQVRMGCNFRPSHVLKLRTIHHSNGGTPYTLGADP
jgi:lipopolysaccharide/colanic/teichoic acid biosynthesis glycosyltransferase